MPKYIIAKDSVVNLGGVKTGLTVTFIDEKNGKEDCTCYHEIESLDVDVINKALEASAVEYENRVSLNGGDASVPALETGVEVQA